MPSAHDPLNHQELHQLNQEMSGLVSSLTLPTQLQGREDYEQVKESLQHPEWQLEAFVTLSGKNHIGFHIDSKVDIAAMLKISPLLHELPETGFLPVDSLASEAKKMGGEEWGNQLSQVVVDAASPQAKGYTTQITLIQSTISNPLGDVLQCHLIEKAILTLTLINNKVEIDLSALLTHFDPTNQPLFHLDSTSFKEHCQVDLYKFQYDEPISLATTWDDTNPSGTFHLIIQANFTRV